MKKINVPSEKIKCNHVNHFSTRLVKRINLALYIRDCESLCVSDEILKSRWSLLSGVYARGSKRSHTGGKCVTCRGLHIPA